MCAQQVAKFLSLQGRMTWKRKLTLAEPLLRRDHSVIIYMKYTQAWEITFCSAPAFIKKTRFWNVGVYQMKVGLLNEQHNYGESKIARLWAIIKSVRRRLLPIAACAPRAHLWGRAGGTMAGVVRELKGDDNVPKGTAFQHWAEAVSTHSHSLCSYQIIALASLIFHLVTTTLSNWDFSFSLVCALPWIFSWWRDKTRCWHVALSIADHCVAVVFILELIVCLVNQEFVWPTLE